MSDSPPFLYFLGGLLGEETEEGMQVEESAEMLGAGTFVNFFLGVAFCFSESSVFWVLRGTTVCPEFNVRFHPHQDQVCLLVFEVLIRGSVLIWYHKNYFKQDTRIYISLKVETN